MYKRGRFERADLVSGYHGDGMTFSQISVEMEGEERRGDEMKLTPTLNPQDS